jgi:hypothetical protein
MYFPYHMADIATGLGMSLWWRTCGGGASLRAQLNATVNCAIDFGNITENPALRNL